MSPNDGSVLGVTKIVDNGPDAQLWNLAILAEGYQSSEMATFHDDASNFVATLQTTAPYQGAWASINVLRVDVTSTDSGAGDPTACGGTGATPKTYFDATFCGDGTIQRLLVCNDSTVHSVVNQYVPTAHAILVIVNSPIYGGSESGGYGTFSTAPQSDEIGLHELGHTFGLADEYAYWAGCGTGETGHDHYTGSEPVQPNVTANTDRSTLKWRLFLNSATAVPTTQNADCTQCDGQASPVPAGTVGLFEGAYYNHCGAFRPEYTCRMRELYQQYCTVCSFVIGLALASNTCTISLASSGGVPSMADLGEMRAFRDQEMVSSRFGLQLIALLDRYGPEMAGQFAIDERLRTQAAALLQRVHDIVTSGRGPEPRQFDREVTAEAARLLDQLVARSGSGLRNAADELRAHLNAIEGKTAIEVLHSQP